MDNDSDWATVEIGDTVTLKPADWASREQAPVISGEVRGVTRLLDSNDNLQYQLLIKQPNGIQTYGTPLWSLTGADRDSA